MKIVVTGACGHIGSKLVRELPRLLSVDEIVMIDNLSTMRFTSLFNLPDNGLYRFVEADVTETDLDPLLAGATAVVHLAAITDATSSFDNAEAVERNNFETTRRVAEACLRTGAGMIMVSSTSVYGTQNERVDETCGDDELKPQSPYAETKLREERLLADMAERDGLRAGIFRFGTIVGTSPGMRFHTAVNKFCWQAVMGKPITVWRTAYDQMRPYLRLDDAIRAIAFLIETGRLDGRVYNVVSENLTVRGITDIIRQHVPGVEITFVDSKIMNQLSYEVDNTRLVEAGFHVDGGISGDITDTIALLGAANGRAHP